MKPFFYKLPGSLRRIFTGYSLLAHGAAIVTTFILVRTGLDWSYFLATRSPLLFKIFIPAAPIGFIVPILIPLALLFAGARAKNGRVLSLGYAIAQSEIVAWFVSTAYKTITGRAHPLVLGGIAGGLPENITTIFRFGLFKGGIFWGWPSSHTAVAFAMAATIAVLLADKKIRTGIFLYAFYIGVGVSLTIHWLSDFVAGAILGTLVGMVIGAAFKERGLEQGKSKS